MYICLSSRRDTYTTTWTRRAVSAVSFSQPLIIFPFRSEPGVENWLSWISGLSLSLSLCCCIASRSSVFFFCFCLGTIVFVSFSYIFPELQSSTGGTAFSLFFVFFVFFFIFFTEKCSCVWIKQKTKKGRENEEEGKSTIMEKKI